MTISRRGFIAGLALTGAAVAALTVYDMCKAVSLDMTIQDVRLVGKRGGKRDFGEV